MFVVCRKWWLHQMCGCMWEGGVILYPQLGVNFLNKRLWFDYTLIEVVCGWRVITSLIVGLWIVHLSIKLWMNPSTSVTVSHNSIPIYCTSFSELVSAHTSVEFCTSWTVWKCWEMMALNILEKKLWACTQHYIKYQIQMSFQLTVVKLLLVVLGSCKNVVTAAHPSFFFFNCNTIFNWIRNHKTDGYITMPTRDIFLSDGPPPPTPLFLTCSLSFPLTCSRSMSSSSMQRLRLNVFSNYNTIQLYL